jgi:flagellar biosynthesis protein FlhF
MNVKSFEAPSLAEAMGLVRAELGEDAMIVATRSEANGLFRVLAAIEGPPPAKPPEPAPKPAMPGNSRNPRIKPAPWITTATKQASARGGGEASASGAALQALELHRATSSLRQAFQKAAEQRRGDAVSALAALFKFESVRSADSHRSVLLVGPPGAGKTALAAKLAAHHVLAGGRARLIAADTITTGGADRLRALARVLGVQVEQVDRPAALRDMLAGAAACLTIVDTAAVNSRSAADLSTLADLIGTVPATPVLVMPAGLDAADAAETAELFADLGCTHLAATRLDTSWRLGGILSAAHAGGLALTEASAAPTIASGLIQFDAGTLLAHLQRAVAQRVPPRS